MFLLHLLGLNGQNSDFRVELMCLFFVSNSNPTSQYASELLMCLVCFGCIIPVSSSTKNLGYTLEDIRRAKWSNLFIFQILHSDREQTKETRVQSIDFRFRINDSILLILNMVI